MKQPLLILVASTLTACVSADISPRLTAESSSVDVSRGVLVDVPAARLSKPHTFPVQHQTAVTCRFELSEPYEHDDWYPALAIAFSKIGDFSNDAVGEQHVKFSAFFTDATLGRQYEVTATNNNQSVRTPFLQVVDSKRVITLTMAWHEDGYFSYRVKEKNGSSGTAAVYRPQITPTVATVLVSGVRGYLDCDSTVLSGTESAIN